MLQISYYAIRPLITEDHIAVKRSRSRLLCHALSHCCQMRHMRHAVICACSCALWTQNLALRSLYYSPCKDRSLLALLKIHSYFCLLRVKFYILNLFQSVDFETIQNFQGPWQSLNSRTHNKCDTIDIDLLPVSEQGIEEKVDVKITKKKEEPKTQCLLSFDANAYTWAVIWFLSSNPSVTKQPFQSLPLVGGPPPSMEPISKTLDIRLLLTGEHYLYQCIKMMMPRCLNIHWSMDIRLNQRSKMWKYSKSLFQRWKLSANS